MWCALRPGRQIARASAAVKKRSTRLRKRVGVRASSPRPATAPPAVVDAGPESAQPHLPLLGQGRRRERVRPAAGGESSRLIFLYSAGGGCLRDGGEAVPSLRRKILKGAGEGIPKDEGMWGRKAPPRGSIGREGIMGR